MRLWWVIFWVEFHLERQSRVMYLMVRHWRTSHTFTSCTSNISVSCPYVHRPCPFGSRELVQTVWESIEPPDWCRLLTIAIYSICWTFSLKQRNHKKSVHLFFFPHTLTPILFGGAQLFMASSLGHATIGLRHSMDTGLVGVAGAPSFHCGVCASWMDLGRKISCRLQGNVRLLQPSLRVWICSSAELQCMSLPLPFLHMDIQKSNQGKIYIILVW